MGHQLHATEISVGESVTFKFWLQRLKLGCLQISSMNLQIILKKHFTRINSNNLKIVKNVKQSQPITFYVKLISSLSNTINIAQIPRHSVKGMLIECDTYHTFV